MRPICPIRPGAPAGRPAAQQYKCPIGGTKIVRKSVASAQVKAWVVAKLPDTPEGMAVDSKSNIYTTLFHTGEVIMLKDDGSYDHVAWVPSKEETGKGDLIGLDFDKEDNIYVAYKAHSKRNHFH